MTYLCGFLSSPRLALGEGRRRGSLSLLGRLSLRKEDHQRIMFTNIFRSSLNSKETMGCIVADSWLKPNVFYPC